jgi:hypothetical protein
MPFSNCLQVRNNENQFAGHGGYYRGVKEELFSHNDVSGQPEDYRNRSTETEIFVIAMRA